MSYLPALPERIEPHRGNGVIPQDFANQVRDTIRECTRDIEKVSQKTQEIQAQGGWEAFWSKGKNIHALAEYTGTLASVQQKSLEMIVLLMGAAAKMKGRYDIILDSIDDLSQAQAGKVEVLNYLVKVKTMVSDLKERDELLDSLITYTNDLRESLESVGDLLNSTIGDFSAAKNDLHQRQEKAGERLGVLQKAEKELERKLGVLKDQLTTLDGKFQKSAEQSARSQQALGTAVEQLRRQQSEGEQRLTALLEEQTRKQAKAVGALSERQDQLETAASELGRSQESQVRDLRALICGETATLQARHDQLAADLAESCRESAALREQATALDARLTKTLEGWTASQTAAESQIVMLRRQAVCLWVAAAGGWSLGLAALFNTLR